MEYFEINPSKVFSQLLILDKNENLIIFRGLTIGTIEYTDCYTVYRFTLPSLKDSQFKDIEIDIRKIFSESIIITKQNEVYLKDDYNCYIKLGHIGLYAELKLPYIAKHSG